MQHNLLNRSRMRFEWREAEFVVPCRQTHEFSNAAMSKEKKSINCHKFFSRALRQYGIDVVFGIVGIPVTQMGHQMQMEGMRFMGFRNEQAATYAASVMGYLTGYSGKPGVALCVGGPGVVHSLAGFANAWSNSWPMLLIGGAIDRKEDHRGGFQESNHLEFVRPFSKFSARVDDIRRIPFLLDRAIRSSLTGRPGPCYLDFPQDVLESTIELGEATKLLLQFKPILGRASSESPRSSLIASPFPRLSDSERAVQLLKEAKRPLVIIGKGVAYAQAESAARSFIDASGLPFLPTPMGKGVVPDDHAQCVSAARATALKEADVVLVLAARMNWILHLGDRFASSAKVIHVDVCAEDMSHNLARLKGAALAMVADVRDTLVQFNEVLKSSSWNAAEQKESIADWWSTLSSVAEKNRESTEQLINDTVLPMSYFQSIGTVRNCLPRDAIVVNEGSGTMDTGRTVLPTFEARHRLDAGTYATMGLGVGYAIAAQLLYPQKRVVAVMGDSAFGFSGFEIETAARFNLPIIVVIINNNGIYAGIDKIPRSKDGSPPLISPNGLTPAAGYEKMCAAFGGKAHVARTPQEITNALKIALQERSAPTVINVLIETKARKDVGPMAAPKAPPPPKSKL